MILGILTQMMKFEERPAGCLEHLGKVDVQNMRTHEMGQPVDQVFLGIAIAVGPRNGGNLSGILGGPLYPDAGRQLIRVGRVQHPVHRVHQLTLPVVHRRRRCLLSIQSRRLVGSGDGHCAAECKGH